MIYGCSYCKPKILRFLEPQETPLNTPLLAIVNLWSETDSILQLLNKFESGLQSAQMLRLDASSEDANKKLSATKICGYL